MHVNPFAPLIGGLKGNLSFPLVVPEESSLEIGAKVFAPRWGSPFGAAAWWWPPTAPPDTRNSVPISNQGGPMFWKCIANAKVNFTNEATFANVQTNITPCSFPIGIGERWAFRFFVPLRATAGTTGVGFNLTIPASTTGAMTLKGMANTTTWAVPIYTTTLTTNTAKSFCTVATTDLFVEIDGEVDGASAAGTVQLQGQSGAVGTTIQVNRGAYTVAEQSF